MNRLDQHIKQEAEASLLALRRHRRRIRAGKRGEALHDLRVSARRLAALLAPWQRDPALRLRKPLRVVKRHITHSNAIRDSEVQEQLLRDLLPELPRDLASWLAQQRRQRNRNLLALRRQLDKPALPRALGKLRKRLRRGLKRLPDHALIEAIGQREYRLRQGIASRLHDQAALFSDPEHWHALRLACKRWRYLLESHGVYVGSNWETAAAHGQLAQDALGQLRDVELLQARFAEAGLAGPAISQHLEQAQQQRLAAARQACQALRTQIETQQ
ncbi:CHAD domain-containing protein [Chitinimonas sp.]|uniref:CHAD domain-containing protein n=1 Tax=Chitinimonas sp. TaxID=1934313 RepID=UPI0035AEE99D